MQRRDFSYSMYKQYALLYGKSIGPQYSRKLPASYAHSVQENKKKISKVLPKWNKWKSERFSMWSAFLDSHLISNSHAVAAFCRNAREDGKRMGIAVDSNPQQEVGRFILQALSQGLTAHSRGNGTSPQHPSSYQPGENVTVIQAEKRIF